MTVTTTIDVTPGARHAARGVVQLRGVSKQYSVGGRVVRALEDIDLRVDTGELVCIVGASGCGKSTLLRLIVGLDLDYDGEVRVDGERVEGTSLDRGIVFQDHRLFPWLDVAGNVGLGLENAGLSPSAKAEAIAAQIDLVGLRGFEEAYPYQLSGGMAQRAAIARALVSRPRVLLLDEPFGALDAQTRRRLQGELERIWQQQRVTTVLVTHDVEEAVLLGDRVVVMCPRPGRVRTVVPVDLPRQRRRSDPRLAALEREVRALMDTDDPEAVAPAR
jgi:sulfonate transport system ATP-binding protein